MSQCENCDELRGQLDEARRERERSEKFWFDLVGERSRLMLEEVGCKLDFGQDNESPKWVNVRAESAEAANQELRQPIADLLATWRGLRSDDPISELWDEMLALDKAALR